MAAKTAKDLMTPNPITVAPDVPVTDAARLMVDNKIGALPVLSGDKLVGIVTDGDLIMQDVKLEFPSYIHLLDGFIMYPPSTAKFEHELKKAVAATVEDVMTTEPVTVQVDTSIEDVATLFVDRDISRIPVMDGDRLVGVISKSDIVRSIVGD